MGPRVNLGAKREEISTNESVETGHTHRTQFDHGLLSLSTSVFS